jgi:hypothetical protein
MAEITKTVDMMFASDLDAHVMGRFKLTLLVFIILISNRRI